MGRKRALARKPWLWLLGIVLLVLAIQSVTYTPAARLRYVATETGLPISGLAVVAVWRIRAGNFAGSLDAEVIRIQKAHADVNGHIEIGAAAILHAPVFPFSSGYRDVGYLPRVFAEGERAGGVIAASGLRHGGGRGSDSMLSYQRSTLDGETLRVGNPSDADSRGIIRSEIQQAYFSCQRSRLCAEAGS